MKKIYILLLLAFSNGVMAQEDVITTAEATVVENDTIVFVDIKKNFVKLNLTGLILNNYSFQYERVLSKRVSVAFSMRTMPKSGIPFKSSFIDDKEVGKPNSIHTILDNVKMSNTSYTPEVRFYLGKNGYGRGFYIAPYYRYAKFNFYDAPIDFEIEHDAIGHRKETVNFSGDMTSHSFGFYIGSQFPIGKYFYLDWWIIGGHYGTSKGNLQGTFSQTLTDEELQYVNDNLPELDADPFDIEYKVEKNRVKMKLDGPWGGLRTGLSIGFRF